MPHDGEKLIDWLEGVHGFDIRRYIGARLVYRFIPFRALDDGSQKVTLVEEWIKDGKVISDSRRQMDLESFDQLFDAMLKARKEMS